MLGPASACLARKRDDDWDVGSVPQPQLLSGPGVTLSNAIKSRREGTWPH